MQTLEGAVRELQLVLSKRPVALLFAEDPVGLDETIEHHLGLGFERIVVFADPAIARSDPIASAVQFIDYNCAQPGSWLKAANAAIAGAPGVWFYLGFNVEFLLFPFCESRSVGEFASFVTEERRPVVSGTVIDLYPGEVSGFPVEVDKVNAYLDAGTYFASRRETDEGVPLDRQLDFYGGLRWRFEEHLPKARRRIDRVALFRSCEGLQIRPDFTFNQDEYNTVASPWHNSPTAAVCSFRVAKALMSNPSSAERIDNLTWENSRRFEWRSRQLMDLGLMEPGQWF
jgi:hypothetical protein